MGGGVRDVALTSTAQFLPFVVLAVPAGVWSDRLDRKRILVVSDTVKPTSARAVAGLRALGLTPILLTGDNAAAARPAASV